MCIIFKFYKAVKTKKKNKTKTAGSKQKLFALSFSRCLWYSHCVLPLPQPDNIRTEATVKHQVGEQVANQTKQKCKTIKF